MKYALHYRENHITSMYSSAFNTEEAIISVLPTEKYRTLNIFRHEFTIDEGNILKRQHLSTTCPDHIVGCGDLIY